MAITKVTRNLLSTGIDDQSNATAITIDSSGNVEIGSIETATSFPLIVKSGTNDHAIAIEEASGGETWQLGVNVNGDLGFYNSGATSSSVSFIDGAGQVLIGEDTGDAFNADAMLRLQRAGDRVFQSFKVDADQSAAIFFGDVDDDIECGITYEAANQNLIFTTGDNSEALRIDSSGNVGIGTSSPQAELHVSNGSAGFEFKPDGISDGTSYMQVYDRVAGTYDNLRYYAAEHYFHIGNNEKVRIDSSGNVGIAETSPSGKLEVNIGTCSQGAGVNVARSSTQAFEFFANSGANALYSEGNHGYFGTSTAHNLVYVTNGTERMRIDSSGVILRGTTTRTIGTLGDVNALGISGNSGSANPMVVFAETDSTVEASSCILELAYSADTSFSSAFYTLFADSGGTQGTISGTGAGTVSYNTSSDERIKENIVDTGSQLETIKQIQVKDFNYIGKNTTTTGMIAQELNAIIPNVVVEGGDDATKHPWGIDYGKLTPYLIKAIQEQQIIIDNLKTRIETLESA